MTQTSTEQQYQTVEIDEGFYQATLRNAPVDLVAQALSASTRNYFSGGTSGVAANCTTKQFFEAQPDGTVTLAAGLVPHLRRRLLDEGYQMERTGNRQQLFRCQLIANTLMHAALAIAVIFEYCDVAKHNRVLVVAGSNRLARSLARRIRRVDIGVPVIADDSCQKEKGYGRFVRVVNTGMFACVDRLSWDVIVFCGADTALCQDSQYGFEKLRDWPISFCCLRDESPVTHFEELTLESICGPLLSGYLCQELKTPDVTVVMVSAPSTRQPKTSCPFTRRKRAIWENEARNQLIAGIAQVPEEAVPALGDHQHQLTSRSILVESLRHARHLAALLPTEWTITACLPDEEGTYDDSPAGNHSIVTTQRAQDTGINTDLVIRATGGSGPLDILPEGSSSRQVTVDFLDWPDRHLRQDTAARMENYRARGWTVREAAQERS